MFIVLIHEIVTYFDINIIPSYVFDNMKKVIFINSKVFNNVKLKDFSISSIIKTSKGIPFDVLTNKLPMSQFEPDKSNSTMNLSDNTLNFNILSRSNESSSPKNKNGNTSTSSSLYNDTSSTRNIRSNRTNNRVNNSSNNNTNVVERTENNNLDYNNFDSNNQSRQNNNPSNDNIYFNMDALSIMDASRDASPDRRLYTPDQDYNYSTPSTMTPLFNSNKSINSNRSINSVNNEDTQGSPVNSANYSPVNSSTYVPNPYNSIATETISSADNTSQVTPPLRVTPSEIYYKKPGISRSQAYQYAADINNRALINNPLPETYTPSNYSTAASSAINPVNTHNTLDPSYRDSYRLQNAFYVPNIPSTPVSPAPVTPAVPTPAQYNNEPTSYEPYQNLPDANQFAATATYVPINTNPNQVPITRALINNPRPEQRYTTVNDVN
jgi:hypothetical protein